MTQEHPVAPPPELVYDWAEDRARLNDPTPLPEYIATRAAQWGADQELDACCEWLSVPCPSYGRELRNARRPKPQSLKEQALEIVRGTPVNSAGLYSYEHVEIIRRALEQLDD
jgi:hypothetical protein